MSKEPESTTIEDKDLVSIEAEFSKFNKPLTLQELTRKLAYKKTSSQLAQEVKIYDPYCQYEIGDLIYKEYDEPLMVSSKGVEPFKGGIVLTIVNKIAYDSFNCEMIEVDYTGGGVFRKHIDYMKKTKTQVLLPSNLERKALSPKSLRKEEDPRREELPMTDKDLKNLEKNLKSALTKSSKFFSWDNLWQLKEKQIQIGEDKIKKIEKFLSETKRSAATSELVSRVFELTPEEELFPLYCLSLNHTLEKAGKKTFIFVSPDNLGKWNLKDILDSFLENSPLTAPKAKLPSFDQESESVSKPSQEFPLKLYLSWREILSGGLKVPKNLNKDLSQAREYTFTDEESEDDFTVYYYPSSYFFIGLKDFYEKHNVPQGASLTIEKKGLTHFHFWIKKSKKKLTVPKIIYDSKKDKFDFSGEDVFTFALPNKIIHLQRETLTKLFSLYDQRRNLNLQDLLSLAFRIFGVGTDKPSLHYLRAYHLVDVLKRTSEEEIEKTLLSTPEFSLSEKKKGIYHYQEKIEMEEEKEMEAPSLIPAEPAPEEAIIKAPPQGPATEIAPPEFAKEREEILRAERHQEALRIEIEEPAAEEEPAPLKKEKEFKKKKTKLRPEVERAARRRKAERKIIEERIELEESEQEALIARKAKEKKELEEEKVEAPSKEKQKEFKTYVSEGPVFGVFAEKLKTALDKKKKEKKKE